ncbi:hypothetical protein CsSME_00044476 [Camellia sinensis var. sinensis]
MGPNMEIGPIVIMRKNLTLSLGNLKEITKLGSCAYEPERTSIGAAWEFVARKKLVDFVLMARGRETCTELGVSLKNLRKLNQNGSEAIVEFLP